MQFNYILKGDRSQPTILFLHGFMGDCRDFDAVIDLLDEFCCLVVDLPGHGRTPASIESSYQMGQIALGLTKLLKQLEIEQCILVGYSMGGRIALYLTIYFPQFFWGIVLESASPGLATQPERDRRILQDLQLSERLIELDFADFLASWYDNPLFESFKKHPLYARAVERRLRNNPAELAKCLRVNGLGQQPSLWSRLTEINKPLMLIVGELDTKFMLINRKISDAIPQACLSIVKDSGHNVHFEHPIRFSQLLKDFGLEYHRHQMNRKN